MFVFSPFSQSVHRGHMMGSVEHCSQASEYYGQVSEKCGVFLSVKRRYWLLIFSRWKSNAEEMSDCRRFSGLAELHWPAKHLISGAAKGQSLSNLACLYNASVLSAWSLTGLQSPVRQYMRLTQEISFLVTKRNQPFRVVR